MLKKIQKYTIIISTYIPIYLLPIYKYNYLYMYITILNNNLYQYDL